MVNAVNQLNFWIQLNIAAYFKRRKIGRIADFQQADYRSGRVDDDIYASGIIKRLGNHRYKTQH